MISFLNNIKRIAIFIIYLYFFGENQLTTDSRGDILNATDVSTLLK